MAQFDHEKLADFAPRDEPSTNASLLRRAQSGSADGWSMLVQVYGPIVYRWIRRCGVQSADAADIMQETFLSVTSALPRFDAHSPSSSFRGWLWTIARNKLRDRGRRDGVISFVDGSKAAALIDRLARRLRSRRPTWQCPRRRKFGSVPDA